MLDVDIPVAAPDDAIMASPEEIRTVIDWADATFAGEAKSAAAGGLFGSTEPPFSFVYGGVPSSELLKNWKREAERCDGIDHVGYLARWKDARTGLVVTAEARAFKDYPAVDWLLYFENQGERDTPIIENIQAADMRLATGEEKCVIHRLNGDSCGESSFTPSRTVLGAGLWAQKTVKMAPRNGRPSQETAFPFWNFQAGGGGVMTALGWSGQWAASYERDESGETIFKAGMELTHLLLHPGEKIRTPRVLMMTWRGDRRASHNRFRRLMLFHYVPKLDGKPVPLPIALQTFDRYCLRPGWATEAGQLDAVKKAHKLGCDTYWFDAAWFEGDFSEGAGNWYPKPKEFPRGLKPIGDLCRELGMGFILWFEPCRVHLETQIAREHPEWVWEGHTDGLYNLGNPEARQWMTDLLSSRISEYGITFYREDFNIDPLQFWRKVDAPDRQGMSEIRFVEGHYAMWDALLAGHPGLMIDNCASGGRRIDLETCMRSVPLWRSDTSCFGSHSEWNQMQSYSISQYIPLHTACGWEPDFYEFRSSATGGAICQFAYLEPDFPLELAREIIAEAKENQKYWYGDFYQLTQCGPSLEEIVAYQFHREDLGEGLILAFRRPECDYMGVIVSPRAIDPAGEYSLRVFDGSRSEISRTLSGKDLISSGLELRFAGKRDSLVIRYIRA